MTRFDHLCNTLPIFSQHWFTASMLTHDHLWAELYALQYEKSDSKEVILVTV
jgi:hypothetical protein